MIARHKYYRSEDGDLTNKSIDSEDVYGNFNPNLNQHLLNSSEKSKWWNNINFFKLIILVKKSLKKE